jgi:CBS domain-containing protein
MTVKDVMTRDVRACEPSATVREAAALMAREDIGPIPVVEDGRLVGIVADRDLVIGKDAKTGEVVEEISR